MKARAYLFEQQKILIQEACGHLASTLCWDWGWRQTPIAEKD